MGAEGKGREEIDVDGDRASHGWWPYWAPYFSFLLLAMFTPRFPEAVQPWMLVVKPAVPVVLIAYFLRQGAYPELRGGLGRPFGGALGLLDVALGVALALLWMGPYILFPVLRPDPGGAFDPNQFGADRQGLTLGLRLFGYAFVTPVFEELFIRSWVTRYAEVWAERGDFRDVPFARYTPLSFVVTIVVFSMGHVPWEYWVAVPWVAITNLWFYYRKNLWALILLHGVTNATLLGFAVWGGSLFHDSDGTPVSLWFFV